MKQFNSRNNRNSRNSPLDIGGFSLIELIFAMVFITVIILGVVKLQTSNVTLSNTQQNELQANFLVTQGLEIVEGIGKTGLVSCPCKIKSATDSYSLESIGAGSLEKIGDLFERKIEADPTGLTNAFKTTVTVSWEDSSGAHSVSAQRIIY